MAKKSKKDPQQNWVDKEDRYYHGIVYQVCAYLTRIPLFDLCAFSFVMSNKRIADLADCMPKSGWIMNR